MNPEARVIWSALEFRKPEILFRVIPLSAEQLHWIPPNGRNSIAWQIWHIAEVEDNWIRHVVLEETRRYPFGRSVHEADREEYPSKDDLLTYFHEVRGASRGRLEGTTEAEFERLVRDDHYGNLTVRDVWGGVITSFAWHAG